MFRRISGAPKMEWFRKKASTAFAVGDLVYFDGAGAIQPADATSGDHIGVCLKEVTSTDDDYASTTKIPVDFATPDDIFEVDVETGTLTAAMVGNTCDLASADGIDVSASAKDVVTIVGFVSATKALVKINAMVTHKAVATT